VDERGRSDSGHRKLNAHGLRARIAAPGCVTERASGGKEQPLPREKFYIPTSVLRARVASSHPLAWGIPDEVNVTFDNSPVYRASPDSALKGLHPVACLRSGWAWGQHYLKGGVAVAEAKVGEGKFYVFGPEITFRRPAAWNVSNSCSTESSSPARSGRPLR
jgi:hypothetical protein